MNCCSCHIQNHRRETPEYCNRCCYTSLFWVWNLLWNIITVSVSLTYVNWINSGSVFSIRISKLAMTGQHSHIFPSSLLVLANVTCNSVLIVKIGLFMTFVQKVQNILLNIPQRNVSWYKTNEKKGDKERTCHRQGAWNQILSNPKHSMILWHFHT